MANINFVSGKAGAKKELTQFKQAVITLKGVWSGFTVNDKQNALTVLSTVWASATAPQKADAIRVALCLLYVMVGYLVWRELDS